MGSNIGSSSLRGRPSLRLLDTDPDSVLFCLRGTLLLRSDSGSFSLRGRPGFRLSDSMVMLLLDEDAEFVFLGRPSSHLGVSRVESLDRDLNASLGGRPRLLLITSGLVNLLDKTGLPSGPWTCLDVSGNAVFVETGETP